ncbi:MAG: pyrroline-5-carboxylate reductase [Firmicutes bacterium]|nr:pyrroline-5-carboxylate reductase [Bacillota bacterium]
MGGAIIGGIVNAGISAPSDITVSDLNTAALDNMKKRYNVQTVSDNKACALGADILFLCVKPQFLYDVIAEIKDSVSDNTLIVSIAAGQSIERITNAFGKSIKLVRVMPNTPALVGEGMSALAPNENVGESEKETLERIFSSFGKCSFVAENLMDAVTAVSGSSPAYVFMFIEAMADAAVIGGMPRAQAYTFAAQSVLGSAKMVLETGKHPGELKDMVCSPAGTTIDAVAALEKNGMRSAVIDAMLACMKKSKELG